MARDVDWSCRMANVITTPQTTSTTPRTLLAAWLAGATLLAASVPLSRAPFLVPIAIFGVVIAGIVLYRRSPAVRAAVDRLDTRALLAVHVVRAPIGLMFLLFYSRGMLPAIFAVRAGVGDTLAGLGALLGILAFKNRKYLLSWNVLGLVDIAMSVATAQKVLVFDPDPIAIRTTEAFPFPLIPFVVVPAVVLTHLAMLKRLRAPATSSS